MSRQSDLATISTVAHLVGGVLVICALSVAREVFVPLTLAILLSFLLSPLVNRIQRAGIGNVWAVLVTAIFVFVVLASTLAFIGHEMTNLASEIPRYKSELIAKARGFAGLRTDMGERLDELTKEVTAAIDPNSKAASDSDNKINLSNASENASKKATQESTETGWRQQVDRFVGNLASTGNQSPASQKGADGNSAKSPIYVKDVDSLSPVMSWAGTLGNILGPLGTVGLVTVFVLFLLIYRDDMRDRIIKVISRGDYVTTTEALDEVSQRISKYLVAQTIVNSCYGAAFGLGLFLIGKYLAPDGQFPNYALWGALATLLRFVPYIGPVTAAIFPIVLSLAVFPGYGVALSVLAVIAVIELGCNNVLEPWLYGASTGLSSVAIIFAAVFWGWLWGPVGLLLSTPLTVCLVVLGRYVPRFRIFSTLLGEKVEISPSLRFYQRLLSGDHVRASEILEAFISSNNPLKAIDQVLTPALERIRRDKDQDRLSEQQAVGLETTADQVISKVIWTKTTPTESTSVDLQHVQPLSVVAIPSHQTSEELLLNVFARSTPAFEITVVSSDALPEDAIAKSITQQSDVVLILVLPAGGFEQARHLCQSIRSEGYKGLVTVCFSGKVRHFDRLFVKFRNAGANFVTNSLMQTYQRLSRIKTKPKLLPTEILPELLTTST